MPDTLTIHGFDTSNNFKVRVALGYKHIPYDFERIDPADRSEILRLSGQSLTPIMVHGDRVLFDSAAILRYLDANFPDRPKLFPEDAEVLHAIEDWESFARRELHESVRLMVKGAKAGEHDPEDVQRAAALLHENTGRIEEALAYREWLVGGVMSAADVTAAPVVFRALSFDAMPPLEDRQRTVGWVDRVMIHDEVGVPTN